MGATFITFNPLGATGGPGGRACKARLPPGLHSVIDLWWRAPWRGPVPHEGQPLREEGWPEWWYHHYDTGYPDRAAGSILYNDTYIRCADVIGPSGPNADRAKGCAKRSQVSSIGLALQSSWGAFGPGISIFFLEVGVRSTPPKENHVCKHRPQRGLSSYLGEPQGCALLPLRTPFIAALLRWTCSPSRDYTIFFDLWGSRLRLPPRPPLVKPCGLNVYWGAGGLCPPSPNPTQSFALLFITGAKRAPVMDG